MVPLCLAEIGFFSIKMFSVLTFITSFILIFFNFFPISFDLTLATQVSCVVEILTLVYRRYFLQGAHLPKGGGDGYQTTTPP